MAALCQTHEIAALCRPTRILSAALNRRSGFHLPGAQSFRQKKRAQEIAKETGTEIIIHKVEHDPPAVAAPEIQEKIEAAAAQLGLQTMRSPSGVGHDAQMMAKVGPIGMIFVPSVDGIRHSPKEFTRWRDCANGANVLLQTILLVDGLSNVRICRPVSV